MTKAGILSAGIATTLAAGVIAASASAEQTKDQASFLFVQHASVATLDNGILTLESPDANMIIFADRPHRAAGVIPSAELLKVWSEGQDNFADDPPNAALMGQADGKPVALVVELSDPRQSSDTLTFSYTILQGSAVPVLEQSYLVIDESPWADIEGGWDLAADALTGGGNTIKLDADSGVLGTQSD